MTQEKNLNEEKALKKMLSTECFTSWLNFWVKEKKRLNEIVATLKI